MSLHLRDSSPEAGGPIFVTFELSNAADAATLQIGSRLALRRDGRDVVVLEPRVPDAASPTKVSSLNPGTEYRFDMPDIEPGFHQLCANYATSDTSGQTCVELAVG